MLTFMMTPEIAEEFWKRVIERKADTEKERHEILLELAQEGKMLSVSQTKRTKEEYLVDLSKEFKVLDVTGDTNDAA